MPNSLNEEQYKSKYKINFDPYHSWIPTKRFRRTFKCLANSYGLGFTIHFRLNELEFKICIWNFLWSFYWEKPNSGA